MVRKLDPGDIVSTLERRLPALGKLYLNPSPDDSTLVLTAASGAELVRIRDRGQPANEIVEAALSVLLDLAAKMPGAPPPAPARVTRPELAEPPQTFEPGEDESSVTVALRSGGTVTLYADVNIFHLSAKDREFIFALKDFIDRYEAEA